MAKLEDPCPFCGSEIKYYSHIAYIVPAGHQTSCYCSNPKCDLRGFRTLTDKELLSLKSSQPKPAELQ